MVVARTAESLMGRVIGADLAASALKAENVTLRYSRQACLYMITDLHYDLLKSFSNCAVGLLLPSPVLAPHMLCICSSCVTL